METETQVEIDRLKGLKPYKDEYLVSSLNKNTVVEEVKGIDGAVIYTKHFLDLAIIVSYESMAMYRIDLAEKIAKTLKNNLGASALVVQWADIYIYMELKEAPNYINSDFACFRDHARNLLKRSYIVK